MNRLGRREAAAPEAGQIIVTLMTPVPPVDGPRVARVSGAKTPPLLATTVFDKREVCLFK